MNMGFMKNVEKCGVFPYPIIHIADSLIFLWEKNGSAEDLSGSVVTKKYGKKC